MKMIPKLNRNDIEDTININLVVSRYSTQGKQNIIKNKIVSERYLDYSMVSMDAETIELISKISLMKFGKEISSTYNIPESAIPTEPEFETDAVFHITMKNKMLSIEHMSSGYTILLNDMLPAFKKTLAKSIDCDTTKFINDIMESIKFLYVMGTGLIFSSEKYKNFVNNDYKDFTNSNNTFTLNKYLKVSKDPRITRLGSNRDYANTPFALSYNNKCVVLCCNRDLGAKIPVSVKAVITPFEIAIKNGMLYIENTYYTSYNDFTTGKRPDYSVIYFAHATQYEVMTPFYFKYTKQTPVEQQLKRSILVPFGLELYTDYKELCSMFIIDSQTRLTSITGNPITTLELGGRSVSVPYDYDESYGYDYSEGEELTDDKKVMFMKYTNIGLQVSDTTNTEELEKLKLQELDKNTELQVAEKSTSKFNTNQTKKSRKQLEREAIEHDLIIQDHLPEGGARLSNGAYLLN
jgi:hypothetical protein